MALHPVFQRKPFTRVALTNSINRTKRRRKVFDTLFPWQSGEALLDKVQINIGNDNTVTMVASLPRDGVPEVIDGDLREAAEIRIPAFAGRASIYNTEALGVIAGLEGDAVEQNLQGLIDGRNQKIINVIDNSLEHSRAGVFRNQVRDRDGKILLDYQKTFGLSQGEVIFDLADPAKTFVTQLEIAKNSARETVGDDVVNSFVLLVGSDVYFNKLSSNAEYRTAMTSAASIRLSQEDGTEGVVMASNVRIVPVFSANWNPSEAKLIPIIDGAFQRLYGRSTASQFWGTILPFYTTTEEIPHDKGLEMETWSYCLHYFTHPDAILDVVFA